MSQEDVMKIVENSPDGITAVGVFNKSETSFTTVTIALRILRRRGKIYYKQSKKGFVYFKRK